MERASIFIHAYICILVAYLATSAQMKSQCVTFIWKGTYSFNILICKEIQNLNFIYPSVLIFIFYEYAFNKVKIKLFAIQFYFISKVYLFSCVWVLCLYVCLCTMCRHHDQRSKKRVLYPGRLELQIVSAQNWKWVLWKNMQCFYSLIHLAIHLLQNILSM